MRPLTTVVFLVALAASLAWMPPAAAQAPRAGAQASIAQAERDAVDLKQGMTLEEVEELLGKPARTALRNDGSSAAGSTAREPWQGTLQWWTYVWAPEGTLHVLFAARTPEQWHVDSWVWSAY